MTASTLAASLAEYEALPRSESPIITETLRVIDLESIESKPIEWLWPGWLPKGMLTILGGYAGDGKSTITMSLAAAFSTGSTLPDGAVAPLTRTLLMLAEDDPSHVVKPRLVLHGADERQISMVQHVSTIDGGIRAFNLRRDLPMLRAVVEQERIGLIVIDPLSSFLSASDRNNEGDVRDSLTPLIQLMEDTGVAVIAIMHIGKKDGYARSMQRLMGSTAFTALARSVWMVVPLPDDLQTEGEPTRKLLGVSKSNYAIPPAPIQFSRPLDGAIQYHGQSSLDLEELFQWRPTRSEPATGSPERDKAKEFLYAYLAGGMKRPWEIEKAGIQEGHTKRILRRAKEEMNVQSIKVKDCWYWSLPLPDTKTG